MNRLPKKKLVPEPPQEVTTPGADEKKPQDLATAVENAIARMQAALQETPAKPSFAELVRLLQLRKELTETQPRTVTVRWIEEWNETPNEN